jgi:CelD/BcsL family acetyltransferase involved in cellulose biosynthesis
VALRTRLDADADATLTRLRGASGLRKLRSKQRKLMETAPLSHMVARTDEERAAVLSAFLRQKAEWFARQDLPDAFAAPAARIFLNEISAEPTLFEWHALVHGEEIIATFGAALHQGRMSTSVNSYASGDVARHSPGEMLLRELIASACRAGADTFDLGVGDAAYKRSWLDEDEPMVDVVFGVGVSGAMAAATAGLWLAAKASLKQSGLASRLRRLRPRA